MERGFLLIEVVMAIFLAGILWLTLGNIFVGVGEEWLENTRSFDARQQKRIVLEEIIRKTRQAKPQTLKFLEERNSKGKYGRIEMELNNRPGRKIAFYQRGENILKGVKNPDQKRFTGMSIALNSGTLSFREVGEGLAIFIQGDDAFLKGKVFPREGGG